MTEVLTPPSHNCVVYGKNMVKPNYLNTVPSTQHDTINTGNAFPSARLGYRHARIMAIHTQTVRKSLYLWQPASASDMPHTQNSAVIGSIE